MASIRRRRINVISGHIASSALSDQGQYHVCSPQPTAATPALGRELKSQYDYIVVGAGSAGCVVASRLSENPNVSVLLIEAGANNQQFRVRSPMITLAELQNSDIDYAYRTVPQSCQEDRVSHWPRGKCLGGSSSINYMAYVRGDPRNYDDWARKGCEGWSYDEVLPFFKKSENLVGKDLGPSHGKGGPLDVGQMEDGDFSGRRLGELWVKSCEKLGLPKIDYNGPVQTGVSLGQMTCNKGVRCDTASAFLFGTGAMQRKNLTIITDCNVNKIVLDENKRAVGVMAEGKSCPSKIVKVAKEVIVSCGAIGTPQLLMLSGIGPASHLQEHGIECIQDLPVGENLQDHLLCGMNFKVKPSEQPFAPNNPLTGGIITGLVQHFLKGTGNLSFPPLHGTAFYHSGIPGHDASGGNDIQIHFTTFGAVKPSLVEKNFGLPPPGPKFCADSTFSVAFIPIILLPQSVGSVKLASSDPKAYPIIDPKYLSHPRDVEVMVEAWKKCREIARTPPLSDVLEEHIETADDSRPIPYPQESDDYIRAAVAKGTVTVYHPVGTAKMGSAKDATAVVDPELRVKGVQGLRVADASVMPTVISGNTNAPSIMIGERCAAFIQG
mmetsp:Transcript_48737/g.75898  ORF Transcript_48737/g.75898 Transcript_48737/m.75898 type:complete len:609 (+) Transcript_48737:62-1888(+)